MTIPKYEGTVAEHSKRIIESDESMKPILKKIDELLVKEKSADDDDDDESESD